MSNDDYWQAPQSETTEAPPRKKMNGCLLAAIIVGSIGGAMAVVCCGIGAWFTFQFVPKATKEPQEVATVHRKIWTVQLPEDFSPDSAFTIDNFAFSIQLATYRQKEGKGEFVVSSTSFKLGPPDQGDPDQTRPLRKNFEDGIRERIDVKKEESHEITIDGKKVSVRIGEGVDKQQNSPLHTVNASFELGGQHLIFLLRMDDDIWDQDAVLQMLENAKPPERP